MGTKTGIEWCDHTGNIWIGCTKVHEGCDNCYAETYANRQLQNKETIWGHGHPRQAVASVWDKFKTWNAAAKKDKTIRYVFINSLSDLFEKSAPTIDHKGNQLTGTTEDLRNRLFTEVIPNSPHLMFLLLTKRPSNINKMIPAAWLEKPPFNVIFGTSPANQSTYDNLKAHLLLVKGKRFLSIEPQLSYIDVGDLTGIDWVINGGESAKSKHRPFDPEWARDIRDKCKAQDIPFFFKQWDKVQTIPKDLQVREFPNLYNWIPIWDKAQAIWQIPDMIFGGIANIPNENGFIGYLQGSEYQAVSQQIIITNEPTV